MALKPEFISIMREIRDTMYPEIVTAFESIAISEEAITNMYEEIVIINDRIVDINNSIKSITMGTVLTIANNPDGTHGDAAARYNGTLNKFEFDIPAGAKGNTGLQGSTGLEGAQGIQGLKGDTGDKGDTGAQGSTGPTGSQGAQGVAGATGATGSQGPSGIGIDIQGTATLTEIMGKPFNIVGQSWLTSTAGVDSDGLPVDVNDVMRATGSKWITVGPLEGPEGPQGIQGDEGTVGPQGATGPEGIQGIQGTTGAKGDTGDTGAQGVKGDTGEQGLVGETGTTGAVGPKGESYVIRGTDTIANIIIKVRVAGDMWIASDIGTVATVPTIPGDGIYWDGTVDSNVGQIRGPEGVVNFATQAEVDAGSIDDAGVTPETFENADKWNNYLPKTGGTLTGSLTLLSGQSGTNAKQAQEVVESVASGNEIRIPKMVRMSQANYDLITPVATTFYVIVG